MNSSNPDFARKMAKALEEAGVVSDVPDSDPNPIWAAQQAFSVCYGAGWAKEWRELRERLTAPGVPPAAYHRKLAELCKRALRQPKTSEDMREAFAHAWGYFSAKLEAEIGSSVAINEKSEA